MGEKRGNRRARESPNAHAFGCGPMHCDEMGGVGRPFHFISPHLVSSLWLAGLNSDAARWKMKDDDWLP